MLLLLALVAFAGNSLLCRQALLPGADGELLIDPLAFTAIRLCSGALVLSPVLVRHGIPERHRILPGLALWVYAIGFSLSYVTLPAGVGALLLFGSVQVTMAGIAWLSGDQLRGRRAFGMAVAMGGLVVLVWPGGGWGGAPDALGAVLMVIAGVAWGAYSLMGRGAVEPVRVTAWNFLLACPVGLLGLVWSDLRLQPEGVLLAVTSGAITSGLGYAVWYAGLRQIRATTAGIAQLAVPVIAATGGTMLLGEALTLRLCLSGAVVLGGVGVALVQTGRRGAS